MPLPVIPVWVRLVLLGVFLIAATSSWTGIGAFTRDWIPFSRWTLALACYWFWFRRHPQHVLFGLPFPRWAWLAPLAWVFLWPHLVLQEMAYSMDIAVLIAMVLGLLLWMAGLFTLPLGRVGGWLRLTASLLPVGLFALFLLYGTNTLNGGVSRMLVACLMFMAWGTGFLLLLAEDNQNSLRKVLREPINLVTNLGLGLVLFVWVWIRDDRELNTQVLLLSAWVLVVQGLCRWLAHREHASLLQTPYPKVSRYFGRLAWLAGVAIWLIPDTDAVMVFVLLPLLLLFALLAVMAAPEQLKSLRRAVAVQYVATGFAFYWHDIPLMKTLRLPGLFLLGSTLLTLPLLARSTALHDPEGVQ